MARPENPLSAGRRRSGPTPDRVRETLFNWLQPDSRAARCLDLFAGSGALGLEALSRGAREVVFVEPIDQAVAEPAQTLARSAATRARWSGRMRTLTSQGPAQPFDIAFLDPPFAERALAEAAARCSRSRLARAGRVRLPRDAGSSRRARSCPPGWTLHRSKRAGEVGYHLARRDAAGERKTRSHGQPCDVSRGPSIPSPTGTTTSCAGRARIFDHVVVGDRREPGQGAAVRRSSSASTSRGACSRTCRNVEVAGYSGSRSTSRAQHGLNVIVRGLRAVSDFEFEFQLATMSRHLGGEVETVFLTPTEQFNFISSTLIREIAEFGGDVREFVHPLVADALARGIRRSE